LLESKFNSPFILAIYEAIKATKENLKDKKIIALVNSDVFGGKLMQFFNKENLTLWVVPDKLGDLPQLKEFDILITALGQPEIIKGNMIKNGAILIDGGISKKNGKIIGDIDMESVKNKAKWLSPVPGGLGPLTVAFLLRNVIKT